MTFHHNCCKCCIVRIFKRNVMDYIHYMASMINQHRNDGFIDPDDLFYEDASHETGSSQRHDQGVMDEFARLRSFVLPFEASGTASYIPRDQNRVHEVSLSLKEPIYALINQAPVP